MLPQFYQTVLRTHLTPSQYLTLELLVLMLQSYRQIKLSRLANVFPQPIKYESRMRNLQRFLILPKLSVKLLWFPLIKHWIRQEFKGKRGNHSYQRRLKKLKSHKYGFVIIAIDRTQWKERNLIMATIVWNKHALPIYWKKLPKKGGSSLKQQKALLKPVLKLLKPYRVLVLGDREFHSPKLATWLDKRKVDFALRQKKSANLQDDGGEYQALKTLGFQPGTSRFFRHIFLNKEDHLGPFNLGVYWKRKYRGKGPKEPWYILTSLPSLKRTLAIYRVRWGIEIPQSQCTNKHKVNSSGHNWDYRFTAIG